MEHFRVCKTKDATARSKELKYNVRRTKQIKFFFPIWVHPVSPTQSHSIFLQVLHKNSLLINLGY